MRRPRAIAFDCGGTLLHPDVQLLHNALDSAGVTYSPEVDLAATLSRTGDVSRFGLHDIPSRDAFFDIWAFISGIRDTRAPDVLREVAHSGGLYTRLDTDAVPTLSALRERGLRVGVLANDDGELSDELARFGLIDHVDAHVSSHQIGSSKPDAAPFRAISERLHTPPGDCWYVGDSIVNDYLGSLEAGYGAAITFDPYLRSRELPVRRITHLSAVLDLVDATPDFETADHSEQEIPS